MNTPDLTGIRIIHRAMRGDLHRLVRLTEDIATGRERASVKRATALAGFVGDLCHAIHVHHTREDGLLWPLIERSAGAAVDLTDLSDDHAELDPLLDEARTAANGFASNTGDVSALAASIRKLSELLDEHIEDEERNTFPVIQKYVSVADWEAMETSMRKQSGGPGLRFDLGWVAEYANPEEMARLRKLAGPVLSILMALVRPGHRRRQRAVFGSSA